MNVRELILMLGEYPAETPVEIKTRAEDWGIPAVSVRPVRLSRENGVDLSEHRLVAVAITND